MSIRLYNTLTRSLEALPAAPGPIRMYFCGPTVYQRAHVGNARPFVFGMWLRNWLRELGYEATLVHNITDINDSIYEAPRAQREAGRGRDAVVSRGHGAFGLGMPDHLPKATEMVPEIVGSSRS